LTSLAEATPSKPSITQIRGGDGLEAEEFESTPVPLHDEDDDDDVMILDQPSRPTAARKADGLAICNGGKKVQKRKKEAAVPDGERRFRKGRRKLL
jgi:hypothetical protein